MDFAHPHFAEPRWLWLAAVAPVLLLALYRYSAWARARQMALFIPPERVAEAARSHSPLRRALKNFLLTLAIGTMGLALARPQWGEQAEYAQALGEDILFLLDCSRSMLATDVRPDRLSRARLAILDFVQRHGRGRMGLIAFSGQAFLQCPLTFDYDAFREALMVVDDKTIPVPGTDIGRALDEAFRAMEKGDRRKIMVLLTDGEDLENVGVKTARQLADQGVVVFTVGVGTAAGTTIQYLNARGVAEVLRDSKGNFVTSRLDEGTLRAIAEATRGSYQPLGMLGEGMTQVRRVVETSTELHSLARARKLGIDRYHVLVAIIIVLLVVESVVGTRRKLGENRVS